MVLEGTKDNMHAIIKLPNNFFIRYTESILSFQHSQNIKRLKKNQLEAQINAQNNERQNLSKKIASAWRIFSPP
jgi:hypothetical protein